MGSARKLGRDQKGIVESTLVLIPLLALFLITVELIVAVNFRNIESAIAQSAATKGAITSVTSFEDEVILFSPSDSHSTLRMVLTHRRRLLPRLIPDLPFLSSAQDRSTDVVGMAVMEDQP